MIYDYIIVGQGLAGSLLANELLAAKQNIIVINNVNKQSSSSVAGGMFNPVTGKYLTKTWLAESIYPFLLTKYKALEKETKSKFVFETSIYRPFSNLENKEHFLKQIQKNELQSYVSIKETDKKLEKHIKSPFGGLLTNSAGWVDVPKLLEGLALKFLSLGCLLNQDFDYQDLHISETTIKYKNIVAKKIVFCEGFYVKDNPYFNWLPFSPVKGELLVAEIPNYDINYIVNQGKWVIPIDNNTVRIGATYSWHELDFMPTDTGKENITYEVKKFLSSEFNIKSHKAGVRPSTADRRPIMGSHPNYKNMFIFNGLGTKGVSLAPYFVNQFIDFLFFQKDINTETTIERFYSLYSL